MPSLGKNFVLAIAIDRYSDPDLPSSTCKANEVADLVEILNQHYDFDKARTHCLYNENATDENIEQALAQLASEIGEMDNLVFLFNGMDVPREKMGGWTWLTHNSIKGSVSKNLSNPDLVISLKGILARHLLLVSNCHIQPDIFQDEWLNDLDLGGFSSRVVIAAGTEGTESNPFVWASEYLTQEKDNQPSSFSMAGLLRERLANGVHAPQAYLKAVGNDWVLPRKDEEDIFWEKISRDNTPQGYDEYIQRYPNGRYRGEAYQMLANLIAARRWRKAVMADSVRHYEEFSKLFHHSPYAALALDRAKQLMSRARQLALSTKGDSNSPKPAAAIAPPTPATAPSPAPLSPKSSIRINAIRSNEIQRKEAPQKIIIFRREPTEPGAGHAEKEKMTPGQVLCRIPATMTLGKSYQIVIRISEKDRLGALPAGISRRQADEVRHQSDIFVACRMRVRLEGRNLNENFEITPLSPIEQHVGSDTYTQWKFDVFPKTVGNHTIHICATALLDNERYGETPKDVFAWDSDVLVRTDFDNSPQLDTFSQLCPNAPATLDEKSCRAWIAEGHVDKVAEYLAAFFKDVNREMLDTITLIQQRIHLLNNDKIKGQRTREEHDAELARISNNLLLVIRDVRTNAHSRLEIHNLNDNGIHKGLAEWAA